MNIQYIEAKNWLFSRLPFYQNAGKKAFKPGIENIKTICDAFDNPQEKLKTIHVAGTNGKGSTCSLMASAFIENGLKVGLIFSPHILDLRERFTINGELCDEQFVVDFVKDFKLKLPHFQASFFEVLIAMGFVYFEKNKVDIVVVETGMGGRLDSTNIIKPVLSVITNISYDHTDFLGDTLPEIAAEKAGIIKENTPVLIGRRQKETETIFNEFAKKMNAPIYFSDQFFEKDLKTDLKGSCQIENVITAWNGLHSIVDFGLDKAKSAKGFENVRKNTKIKGRWDIISTKPTIIADTGHNPDAIVKIVEQLTAMEYKKLHLVLGFVKGKDFKKILSYFPTDAKYYFTKPSISRGLPLSFINESIAKEIDAQYFEQAVLALDNAKSNAEKNDIIFIGGSTFVVADILSK